VNFPGNVYLTAFAGAFLASLLSLPLWRRWCRRIGLVDDPGHRKIHASPIPLAGGFTVFTGMVAPLLAGAAVVYFNLAGPKLGEQLLSHGLSRRASELGAIVLGALGMLILGWLDDRIELKPMLKFGGQLLIAAIVATGHKRITLFVPNLAFSYAITMLWILTVINAFNFMDNMNGLCAGLGVIGTAFFAIIAMHGGQYLVSVMALLACGALLGFLPYNFPRASAFLGDAGSHLTGYLLAVMAILPHFYSAKNPRVWAVFAPLFILAVPLGDLVWVVLLRWRLGRPFYLGDNNHLSHRREKNGWSRRNAVLVIWLLAAVLGGVSLLAIL
jgi:UDP-GlcNAc:undecaprenyl-phosphate GlcNAc-1-phosphate transferase